MQHAISKFISKLYVNIFLKILWWTAFHLYIDSFRKQAGGAV